MPPEIRHAEMADCEAIAQLAARTFTDAFGHLYRPENLLHHILQKCSADFFSKSLARGDTILMLQQEGVLVGYAKAGRVDLPLSSPASKGAQEIHRLYIDAPHQGKGLGKTLMIALLALPHLATAPELYVGVWQENLRAQQLYTQYGFRAVGKYLYAVGDQYDPEIILCKKRT
jgi:ribosomal protein S18 acetylase RimI-like enzyme